MKYLSPKEFRDLGLLQEINRRLLHPMGLALSVEIDGDEVKLGVILDSRDDPEGFFYAELDEQESWEKAASVEKLLESRKATRLARLGYHIQPVEQLSKRLPDGS